MTNDHPYCLTREKERMDWNIQTEEERKYLVLCARPNCGRGQFFCWDAIYMLQLLVHTACLCEIVFA
jgi:hypothetical protein